MGVAQMNDIKIDSDFAAIKMIEILLQMGLINHATYANIMRNAYSHISQAA